MENQLRLRLLLHEYLNNSLELDDYSELFELLQDTDRVVVQQLLEDLLDDVDQTPNLDLDRRIVAIHNTIVNVLQQSDVEERPTARTRHLIPWMVWVGAGAVAASILVFIAVHLFQSSPNEIKNQVTVIANLVEAMPGSNKAILEIGGQQHTLDGDKEGIVLGGSNLYYEDGTDAKIAIADVVSQVSLRTPRAGQYAAVMSDGTKVWLNAATQLKYDTKYGKTNRIVDLVGEAYFEVKKNAKLPFVVRSNGQEIKVLGTSFNVNAYQEDQIHRTTLVDGALILSTAAGQMPLRPNEQVAWCESAAKLSKSQVDVSRALAWKDGVIDLHGVSLQDAMKMIGRWYDRDIVYEGNIPHVILGGKMSRGVKLSVFLKFLQQNFDIDTVVEQDKIIIQKT